LFSGNTVFEAKGGGGTDFRPFFCAMEEQRSHRAISAAIYFTDGIGRFPKDIPEYPVMWVAMPGAPENRLFPFGEVIRMQ
jgi:predicted metal-dependent peptidase